MKKQLTKSRIIGYLLLLTIASLGVLSATYARYVSQVSGAATATVAAWGSDAVLEPLNIDISGLTPGKSEEYTFQVTNQKDGNVSQVAQEYSFLLETTGNLPLAFTLTSEGTISAGEGSPVSGTTGGGLSMNSGQELTGGILPHTNKVVHTYKLTVSWPESSNQSDYADEIDLVTLTVKAEQILPVSQ